MRIQGLQKLTLIDYPGKVACTVFTAGCNFRCPFCHNASLVTRIPENSGIDADDFFEFLVKRRRILDGVCVSGGEPLIWEDIGGFIKKIKKLGYPVKLDTNGSFPERLRTLVGEGLVDYVAMDVKNSPDAYAVTAGIAESGEEAGISEKVSESIGYLKEGHVPYEFRTTVTATFHTIESIEKTGRWIRGAENYFLQNFVDSGDLIAPGVSGCTPDVMNEMLAAARKYVPNAKLRGL